MLYVAAGNLYSLWGYLYRLGIICKMKRILGSMIRIIGKKFLRIQD